MDDAGLVSDGADETRRSTAAEASALVVGAGPAGLVAAERLAAAGVAVTVVDQMHSAGRKFLLAGRGGLNLTHSEPLPQFLTRYGAADVRLLRAIDAFDPSALRSWAEELGEPTFVGTSGRVFPESLRANGLLRSWLARLSSLGVEVRTGVRWCGWSDGRADGMVHGATDRATGSAADAADAVADRAAHGGVHVLEVTASGQRELFRADVAVLALGGASWPKVGSDGRWTDTLRADGIEVSDLRASNCGIDVAWTGVFADRFAGEPIKNVSLTVGARTVRGELMVTQHGLEGGAIYALSRELRTALDGGESDGAPLDGVVSGAVSGGVESDSAASAGAVIHVDLRPDLSVDALVDRLRRRRAKESLSTSLQRSLRLPPVAVGLLREVTGNELPGDPAALAALIRSVPVRFDAMAPLERAISTAGGLRFDQLDDHLMLRSRPGTFVAGEMLDWDAPTGGYLLQASFATGVAAGEGALRWLAAR